MIARPRVPASTYRLQFTAEFGFSDALALVPYLHRLGVTDVYASPLLRATAASTHGYDVVDPTMLDPKFGAFDDFVRFSDELRARDMGLLLDVVPNHMSASLENPWWVDVLHLGERSSYAEFFDIDWTAHDGRLLLPILGGPLDEVLERGELRVEGGELHYFDTRLPLAPGSDVGDVREVVGHQHYLLADWRLQATELNYRRFFDVAELVALRADRPEVFEATHAFVLELVAQGHVTGLRIDHVDGMADPKQYLARLRAALAAVTGAAPGTDVPPFHVVVEKILAEHERLRPDWAASGTSGYEFLDLADGVFVHPFGARRLQRAFAERTGQVRGFGELTRTLKRRTVERLFGGELAAITRLAQAALPDHDPGAVAVALVELTAAMDVYRTYVDADGAHPGDQAELARAAARALEVDDGPAVDGTTLSALVNALLVELPLARRWQQFTSPVMAKSVEDTAFYRFVGVPSREEVGADPASPALSVASYHERMVERAERWHDALNATTTHDTKRSEDVRARLSVLTELHEQWEAAVDGWLAADEPPDVADGYLALTTLVGAWPISAERLEAYLTKALREAKRRTNWTDPDEAYERDLFDWAERQRAAEVVVPFVERVAAAGEQNALSELLLKLTCPGIPDVYQGTELQALSLVDPDNRRPVNHELRDALLDAGADRGEPDKLRLMAAGLRLRRELPELLRAGTYVPLQVHGAAARHAIAFARVDDGTGDVVLALAPRMTADDVTWGDEVLVPPVHSLDGWTSAVTGRTVADDELRVADLLADFPVVLLRGRRAV